MAMINPFALNPQAGSAFGQPGQAYGNQKYQLLTDTQLRAMGLPTSVGGRVPGYTPGIPMTTLPGQRVQPAGLNEALYPSMVPSGQQQPSPYSMPASVYPQLQQMQQPQQQQQPINPFAMNTSGWGNSLPSFYQQALLLAQGKAPPQNLIPTFPPGRFG